MIQRIQELLKQKGLRQNDLAAYLKMPPSTISEWKKGRLRPSVDDVVQTAQFFNVSIDYLLCLVNYPQPIGQICDKLSEQQRQTIIEAINKLLG